MHIHSITHATPTRSQPNRSILTLLPGVAKISALAMAAMTFLGLFAATDAGRFTMERCVAICLLGIAGASKEICVEACTISLAASSR